MYVCWGCILLAVYITGEGDSLKLAVRAQTDSREGVISMQRTVSQLLPHSPDSRFSTVFFFPTLFFGLVKVRSYQGTGPDLAVAVFQILNFRSTAFLGSRYCFYFSLCLFDPNTCHRQGNAVP